MISDTFDHGICAGVADAESFARLAADIGMTGCGTIESDVPDEDIVFGYESRFFLWVDDELRTAEAFPEIVIGITFKFQRHAAGVECPKALSGGTGEFYMHRVFG